MSKGVQVLRTDYFWKVLFLEYNLGKDIGLLVVVNPLEKGREKLKFNRMVLFSLVCPSQYQT